VWGFVPMNLLPKLRTLLDGQPVGSFAHFVDSSPKISDVKYDDKWHTSLIIGEGPGGTFYHSFDVTLAGMADALGGTDSDATASVDQVLTYFSNPGRITMNWAFPSLTKFDPAITPYGDLNITATALEKSVGQTWSDPAVGQIFGPAGPYAVLLGSGFLPYSVQQQINRGGVVAGTTFYIVDAQTGAVLASKDIGSDGVNETNNNCATDNGLAGCQKSKNALISDPVATGPTDSRYVTRTYLGDLDGNIWRFDFSLTGGVVSISATTKLYSAGADQPIYNSMATVTVGTKQYVFIGTGSDLLPQTDKTTIYRLLGVLDNGGSGTKTFEKLLEKTASGSTITTDERVTSFPAVAGDIVFFTTTVLNAQCSAPDARLYAFTFIGGAAYDNTGDNVVKTGQDTPLVKTIAGQRATAPFIVDQHVVFGAGGSNVQMFGDSTDYNNGIGQAGVRILSWREVR
jgi:Tfp pilus tip-associated adhesin PilY1